ncbi:hypothetical protein [Sphingorhabdus sp. Alg239-R122]|uniref:hypothetical protein n=1 Tax=Sphingorhabdus sp. Alg239-R122 TaxID=2305989 RepID=UPI0013DBFA42|nr:hypothetical protein [Sphingorhabdus sp. Alg239-R122]
MAVLTLAFSLAACGEDPTEAHMFEVTGIDRTEKICATSKVEFTSRDSGGGIFAGYIHFRLKAPDECLIRAFSAIATRDGLDCDGGWPKMNCNHENGIEGVFIERISPGHAKLSKWTTR